MGLSEKKEKIADVVRRLEKELGDARRQVENCNHNLGKPYLVEREKQEAVFSHYEGHGSDPWPVYNYYPKKVQGYERECELCGMTQYTEKTKPVIKGYEPDF